jgi:hypothetical protein
VPNVRNWTPDEKYKLLIFAPSKTGKSFGAGTFPRPNFMDFDKGIAVFRNPEFVAKYGVRSIEYEQFTEKNRNSRGIVTNHNAFDDACRYFDSWMKPGNRDQFDTWVIDSGTTLSEFAMNKAIVLLGGKQLAMASKTHDQAINTGLVYPKQQDYGSERSMVEQFVDMVKDTDKHVVLICHEKVLTDDSGTVVGRVPLLTGKGVEAVCVKFDEIYYLKTKKQGTERVRFLMTHTEGITKVGTRYGIPDGTAWEWDELDKVRRGIHAAQKAATPK